MKGIYLCAYKARHDSYDLVYQDKFFPRDIGGDCLDVDLSLYDFVICTPPCNWWSRANFRRNESEYSLSTRHLLPVMLLKLTALGKPFIVENVRSEKLFNKFGLFSLPLYVYTIGRHTYWTNVALPYYVKQKHDNIAHINRKDREGGDNVHEVIEIWLEKISRGA